MADAICQLRDAGNLLLHHCFFVFGPQMLIGMAAAECSHKRRQGRRRGLSACLLILVRRCWLAAGESTRYLALERIFCVIAIAAGISALLLLPFLNAQHREKRDASHLFTSYPAKLRNFQVLPGRYLRPDLLLIFTMLPHAGIHFRSNPCWLS